MKKAVVLLMCALLILALAAWGYSKIEIMVGAATLALLCYICFLKAEIKKTKAELAKAKELASQLNSNLIIANRQIESFRAKTSNQVVRPQNVKSPNRSKVNTMGVSRYSLSEIGETPKVYGKNNVFGRDIALDVAPVADAKAKTTIQKAPAFLNADDPMDALLSQIGVSE